MQYNLLARRLYEIPGFIIRIILIASIIRVDQWSGFIHRTILFARIFRISGVVPPS